MSFNVLLTQALTKLIAEADGDDGIQGNEDGVEGVDVLDPNQDSALDDTPDPTTSKLVFLSNILLDSLRFKASDEYIAYLHMPMFKELKPYQKFNSIRNVLSDHPDRIFTEADDEVSDFGEMSEIDIDEATESDMLRLIIKALVTDPYKLDYTLDKLPTKADKSNYETVITTAESILL